MFAASFRAHVVAESSPRHGAQRRPAGDGAKVIITAANLNIRAYLLKPIVPDAVLDMVETLRKEIVAGQELRRRKGWT